MRKTGGKRTAVLGTAAIALGLVAAGVPMSVAAQDATPPPAIDCARSDAEDAMQMWERSGGNKGMVDQLVCDWNAANPDKPINLSYIPHVETLSLSEYVPAVGAEPVEPKWKSFGVFSDVVPPRRR